MGSLVGIIDTETGGLIPGKVSLLCVGTHWAFLQDPTPAHPAWELYPVATCCLWPKPADGKYIVERAAMQVNKINLAEVVWDCEIAEVGEKLREQRELAYRACLHMGYTVSDDVLATPVGWNVGFDIAHLKANTDISDVFHYAPTDVMAMHTFFYGRAKLSKAYEKIAKNAHVAHTATGDCMMTAELYEYILQRHSPKRYKVDGQTVYEVTFRDNNGKLELDQYITESGAIYHKEGMKVEPIQS